jgi:hypothetical protein
MKSIFVIKTYKSCQSKDFNNKKLENFHSDENFSYSTVFFGRTV